MVGVEMDDDLIGVAEQEEPTPKEAIARELPELCCPLRGRMMVGGRKGGGRKMTEQKRLNDKGFGPTTEKTEDQKNRTSRPLDTNLPSRRFNIPDTTTRSPMLPVWHRSSPLQG